MLAALKNFALVTLLIVILVALSWFYLRQRGLSQAIKPPLNHVLLATGPSGLVYYPSSENPLNWASLDPLVFKADAVWLDVRPRRDGTLVLASIEPQTESSISVAEALTKTRDLKLILNFRGNRPGMVESALKVIDEAKAGDRVLIQSPEDGFLKEVREARSLWVFGTGLPQLTRLAMLSAIGLEASAPLKGDALVIELGPDQRMLRSGLVELVKEGKRRRMKVIAGPVRGRAEFDRLRSLGVDAVLTNDPELFALPF